MGELSSILDFRVKYGFSLGHVFNDCAASVWFTYSLLFYNLSFGGNAYMFLVFGQLFDAVVTILIGIYFDGSFTKSAFFRLGKYKTWYLIGLALLTFSFPICFAEIPLLVSRKALVYTIYLLAICISQIGWSFMQISHLSLINELSATANDRIWLTSIRQAASLYSAIVVYVLFWLTLQGNGETSIAKQDIFVFANNSEFVTFIGLIHSLLFVVALKERTLVHLKEQYMHSTRALKLNTNQSLKLRPMDHYNRLDWFYDLTFYKITWIFTMAKMFLNCSLAYVPLYLQDTLFLSKSTIATVPLICFVSGFFSSFVSNYIESRFSNKLDLLLGVFFGVVASLWISFGSCSNEPFTSTHIYLIAVLLGISTSIIRLSTVSLVADLIGQNTESCSFVYGTVSFFEKVIGGLAITAVEQFNPQADEGSPSSFEDCLPVNATHSDCKLKAAMYYHYVLSYGNAFILFLILLGLLSIVTVKLNKA